MKIQITIFLSLIFYGAFSQEITYLPIAPPYLEVSEYVEEEIDPDEIFVNVSLSDDYKPKQGKNIHEKEKQMVSELLLIGVQEEDIRLQNAHAQYNSLSFWRKRNKIKRNYTIQVKDVQTLNRVYEKLNELNHFYAYISEINYSKRDSLEEVLKIHALKKARKKAVEMATLLEIDLGQLMSINNHNNGEVSMRGCRSTETPYYIDGIRVYGNLPPQGSKPEKIQTKTTSYFRKITLRKSATLKYLIANQPPDDNS